MNTGRPPEADILRAFCVGWMILLPTQECLAETENLVYIDFDVVHDIDIAVYPDSDKIGIWGMGSNKIYPQSADVDYYDGE